MHWKIFAVIAVVVVMLMTVPPVKVKAQTPGEVALSLPIVVAVGPQETVEIHWLLQANQGKPQTPILGPVNRYYTIALDVTDTGDTTCRQTIQAQVLAYPGRINTLTLAKKSDKLFINGEESKESLIPCNSEASRNAYVFGLPFNNQIYIVAITDDTGGTRAFHAGTNHLKSKAGDEPLWK